MEYDNSLKGFIKLQPFVNRIESKREAGKVWIKVSFLLNSEVGKNKFNTLRCEVWGEQFVSLKAGDYIHIEHFNIISNRFQDQVTLNWKDITTIVVKHMTIIQSLSQSRANEREAIEEREALEERAKNTKVNVETGEMDWMKDIGD